MTDTILYEVKGKTGEIDFRHDHDLVIATVDNAEDSAGFNLLFVYIFGTNKALDSIPVTASVITS